MTKSPSRGRVEHRLAGIVAAVLVAVAASASATPAERDRAVAVGSLAALEPDAVGTLSADAGGFGADLWRGSARQSVGEDLAKLPTGAPSPVMADLARRLLLTAADPPEGASGAGSNFLLQRAQPLLEAGRFEDVVELTGLVPDHAVVPGLARVAAEARFLGGDPVGACRIVAGFIASNDDPFWPQALAFCQASAGDHEKASLTLSVLEESGRGDPAFAALIANLAGETRKLGTLREATPLVVAAAKAAKQPLPDGASASGAPWLARAIATSANAPAGERLAAAERAHASGALPAEAVRNLYSSLGGSSALPQEAAARAEAYRAVAAEASQPARARLVVAALKAGREQGRYAATADLYADVLMDLDPGSAPVDAAPEIVSALLTIGALESAASWLEFMAAEDETNSAARAAVTQLTPLLLIAGWPAEESEAPLALWQERTMNEPGGLERLALVAALFEALDVDAPATLEAAAAPALATAAASPEQKPEQKPETVAGRLLAAQAASPGETALVALIALGEGGPAVADPDTLRSVVSGLRGAGFEQYARGVAVEAATARGL